MTVDDFARLARVIKTPLVLVSATTGHVLAANPAASALCPAFAAGARFADALVDDTAAERLRAWSQHGSPVPGHLTVRGGEGPVTLRVQAARVELAGGPAVLVHGSAEQQAPFAQLNDELQHLQREVRYRIAAERERVAALEAEQAARAELECIQQLSAALAGALDVDDVIDAVLTHAAAAVGAEGVVLARLEGDVLEVFRGDHETAAGVPSGTLRLGDDHPLAAAARDRQPRFAAGVGELAAQIPGSPAVPAGTVGYLAGALPLAASARGGVLGALGIVCRPDRALNERQRATAELVTLVCAESLDRARLYDRERRFAETLQWALLPATLPEFDRFDLAVEYLPASQWAAVGGDWYDAFRLGSDRVGLVVGDVAGHGPAAATVMAQMRNALRAFATEAAAPGEALAAFNDYLCAQLPDDMATTVFVTVDHAGHRLYYANAGHLPPLLLHDGGQQFLDEVVNPPVGVTPGQRYDTVAVDLPGSVRVVCYSDGLIECRGEPIDLGLRRLERAAAVDEADAQALCTGLIKRLVGETHLEDDAVLLVADVSPLATAPGSGRPARP